MDRLDRLRSLGIPLYPSQSDRTHTVYEAQTSGMDGEECVIAGRLIGFDKETGIGEVRDASGSLICVRSPEVGTPVAAIYAELIDGDIVECTGRVTGNRFVFHGIRLLVPSRRPSPETIPDEAVALRAEILRYTRRFFEQRGFLAAETPYFFRTPDFTPGIRSFRTSYHSPLDSVIPLYLQTSPEHYMKRLLAQGYERIYQICRFFRDGERYDTHHPEFTGLEWYQAYGDYHDIMRTTEEFIASLTVALAGRSEITYQGRTIRLDPPWPRRTVRDAVRETTGIDLRQCTTVDRFRSMAIEKGISAGADDTWEDVFHRLFIQKVEPELPPDRPIFLIDYPAELPSLAKRIGDDDRFVERFELYIGGLELANAFTELNDPEEQRARFDKQRKIKQEREGYAGGVDEALLAALEWGMPPAGGIALGLDRLIMLYADAPAIDGVIPFRNY